MGQFVIGLLFCVTLLVLSFRRPLAGFVLMVVITAFKWSAFGNISILVRMDLTLLTFIYCSFLMVVLLLRAKGSFREVPFKPILGMVLMALWVWTGVMLSFSEGSLAVKASVHKAMLFSTTGLLAFIAPVLLVRDPRNSHFGLVLLAITGMVIALNLLLFGHIGLSGSYEKDAMRMSLFATSGLMLSAMVGTGVTAMFGLAIIHRKKWLWCVLIGYYLLAAGAIIVTGSRGPAIWALGLAPLYLLIIRRPQEAIKYIVPLVLLVVGIYLVLPLLEGSGLERIKTISEGDFSGRATIWRQALTTWLENPVFGVGTSVFAYTGGFHPHNIFLESASEHGIIGLVLICLVVFGSFVPGIREAFRRKGDPVMRAHLQAWLLVAGGLFLEANKSSGLAGIRVFFFCLGMLACMARASRLLAEDTQLDLSEFQPMYEGTASSDS